MKAMIELVTVTSKDDDNIVVDKVIEKKDNITNILAISKETLVTETKEKAEEGKKVIEDDYWKITSNGEIKINLMESTKIKELERIGVDIKEVYNINDQIEA